LILSYLRIVKTFWSISFSGRLLTLFLLFSSGMISKTFQLCAFFLAIKIFKNERLVNLFSDYTGQDGRFVGILLVFSVMLVWATGSKYFSVWSEGLSVYLEHMYSEKIVNSQYFFHKQKIDWYFQYEENTKLINEYPKKLAASGKFLFLIAMYFLVVILVFIVLFFINKIVTAILLVSFFVITLAMPFMHKMIKRKKARFLELSTTSWIPRQNAAKAIQAADTSLTAEEVYTPLGESMSAVNRERLGLNRSVENSAYLVNVYFSCSVAGLLGWYLYEMETLGHSVIAEMAIYLLLIRFLSSYGSTLFRNLSNFNSEFQYVSKYIYYQKKYDEHMNLVEEEK